MIFAEAFAVLVVLFVVCFFLRHKPFMPFRKKIKATEAGQSGQQLGLGQSETDFILTSIPGFLCLKDPGGHWLQVSDAYQGIYRLAGIDCVGHTDYELCQNPTSDQEALRVSVDRDQEAWDFGNPISDVHVLHPAAYNTENVSYEITRTPIFDKNNQRLRLLVTGKPLDAPSRVNQDVFSAVFYYSKLPFLLLDSEMKMVDSNNAFTSFTGYSKRDAKGQYFVFLGPDANPQEYAGVIRAFLEKRKYQSWAAEADCHCKNGRVIPVKLMVSRISTKLDDARQIYYLAYLSDIRKQKEDEQRLMQIAHYDELTGLPNRTLFYEQLTRSLSLAARHKLDSSVIFINLDRFKTVNESLGHQAGNVLLKEVANRLIEVLRNGDVLARFSADEFAIMHLNEKSHEEAVFGASILSQLVISKMAKPFYLLDQEVYISVSIGIAVFPEDAHNAEVMLKHAEIAMHEAKKQGSNNFHYFQKQYTSKAKDRHQLESNLRRALQRSELLLHYQPQYKADDGKLCGAEVLIRWLQGGTKMISPYYFID
ncbi:partial putative signaling protein, partial [Methylococcales bacterium]